MRQDSGSTRPRVAAIIPCFNAARYVGEAIESVLAQTYDNIEVIVVNDGSTDDLGRAIKPFRDRITVIEQPNSGIGAARNRGIAATGAAYVAFLDADDRWHPDKTAKQAAILTAEPHCGLVHTSRILMDSEGRVVRESPLVPGSLPPARGECLGQLVKANSIFVSSVMVRYSMLDDEPFATDLRGVEDWDLWIRLAARTRFACIDEPLTDYRVHATNFSWNKLAMARATVKLMDGVLLREHDPSIRRVATAHRHEYMLEVAHLEYERGNHREARRWFREAAPGLHAADVMRYGATYMPRLLHGAAQTAWRVLRGIRSGA